MARSLRNCDRSGGLEEKLHEDFLLYLTHTKWALTKLPEGSRKQAEKWLKYLLSFDARTLAQKKERNLHLSELLLNITSGELTGLYAEGNPPKPNEPLPPHPTRFTSEETPQGEAPTGDGTTGVPDWVRRILDDEETAAGGAAEPEVKHVSKDGRVYLATRALPKQPGAFGYLSISMEKAEEGESGAEGVFGTVWCGGDDGGGTSYERSYDSSLEDEEGSCPMSNQKNASRLLAKRRPPEAREKLNWMHDNLVCKVERAMKGEKVAAVETVLEKMLGDAEMDPNLADLPQQAKRDELLRRMLDAVIRKKRNVARREDFLRRMEERVPPFYGDLLPKKPPDCGCGPDMTTTATRISRPDFDRGSCQNQSDGARNIDQVLASAKEDIEAEANAEFNETLESIRGEIKLDLSCAAAEYQRAKSAYEKSSEVRDKLRQGMNEDSGRMKELECQLENLKIQRESYSQALAQESQNLCSVKEQAEDILACRQGEVDNLQQEVREKELYLADLMKYYGERLEAEPE